MNLLFLILLPIAAFEYVSPAEWSYDDQANWRRTFAECGGSEQSPIDIKSNRLFYNASTRIQLNNFAQFSTSYSVLNNGHTVQFTYVGTRGEAPTISRLTGTDTYQLAQFHLHWGQKGVPGSEHTIDGKRFDMELHMVFFNRDKYTNFEDALNSRQNGVAVLGVFYETRWKPDLTLKGLTRNVRKVSKSQTTYQTAVPVDYPIRLDDLLPDITPRYPMPIFQYRGSLTTPPCTEGITWLVMSPPRRIGKRQMQIIQSVQDGSISNNYRTVQPINGRLVQWIDWTQ